MCAVTGNGGLWHTIRQADGSWFPFGDVKKQAGDPGGFVDVGCWGAALSPATELQVVGVIGHGYLWHTIRSGTIHSGDGSWQPFGDVEKQAGDPGGFETISIAG